LPSLVGPCQGGADLRFLNSCSSQPDASRSRETTDTASRAVPVYH